MEVFSSTRAGHAFNRNSEVPSRHEVIKSFDNSAVLLHLFYSWHQFILKVVLGDLNLALNHSRFYIKDQLEVNREYSVHATSAAGIVSMMYRRLPSSGRDLPVRHSDFDQEWSSLLREPARSMFTSAIRQALSRGMPSRRATWLFELVTSLIPQIYPGSVALRLSSDSPGHRTVLQTSIADCECIESPLFPLVKHEPGFHDLVPRK